MPRRRSSSVKPSVSGHSNSKESHVVNFLADCTIKLVGAAIFAYVALHYILPKFSLLRQYVHGDRQLFGLLFVYHILTHVVSVLVYRSAIILNDQKHDDSPTRQSRTWLTGVSARLYNAHQNFCEGYTGYVAAVLVSTLSNVPVIIRFNAAFLYLISRLAFASCYALDSHSSRTFFYFVGQSSLLYLFMTAVCHH